MMKRLVKHIEQLLYQEECVVIPNVGAIIRHDAPAQVDAQKGLILPGRYELRFNAALYHDDGLLVHSYANAYSYGYKRAQTLVRKDVEQLQYTLRSRGMAQLGSLGRLSVEAGSTHIVFYPNDSHPFSTKYYGLTAVATLPELRNEIGNSGVSRRGEVVYLPLNLRYLRNVAALLVVALGLYFLPWLAVSDWFTPTVTAPVPDTQYQAGFLVTPKPEVVTPQEEELPPTQELLAGKPYIKAPLSTPKYLLVVASLQNRAEAEQLMEQDPTFGSFPSAGFYEAPNGKVRMFANAFDTLEEACTALNDIVETPQYASAWIYTAK